jgi:hypothetical protein
LRFFHAVDLKVLWT